MTFTLLWELGISPFFQPHLLYLLIFFITNTSKAFITYSYPDTNPTNLLYFHTGWVVYLSTIQPVQKETIQPVQKETNIHTSTTFGTSHTSQSYSYPSMPLAHPRSTTPTLHATQSDINIITSPAHQTPITLEKFMLLHFYLFLSKAD